MVCFCHFRNDDINNITIRDTTTTTNNNNNNNIFNKNNRINSNSNIGTTSCNSS